jgi:hypothetical protein
MCWLTLLFLSAVPFTAKADAGTPLMWAGMLHLFIGNALIGIGEGLALAWLFDLGRRRCIFYMIPANYFSAWAGGLFLTTAITHSLPFDLYGAWRWLWVMVGVTYLMTLILEWPFVFICVRREPERFKKSLWGNLFVQSLSYLLIFGWYGLASNTSLYTSMNVVRPAEISVPDRGIMLFISGTNGDVYSLDLNTRRVEKSFSLHSTNRNDRLLIRPSVYNTNNWDILARLEGSSRMEPKLVVVCSNLTATAAQSWRDEVSPDRTTGTWRNFGHALLIGTAKKSDWNFWTGFWPVEGLHGNNSKTGETIQSSLETPFVAWAARNATHLPGDYVIFQLGDDQICLLEAATKKITLLTNGRGPVVVIPN